MRSRAGARRTARRPRRTRSRAPACPSGNSAARALRLTATALPGVRASASPSPGTRSHFVDVGAVLGLDRHQHLCEIAVPPLVREDARRRAVAAPVPSSAWPGAVSVAADGCSPTCHSPSASSAFEPAVERRPLLPRTTTPATDRARRRTTSRVRPVGRLRGWLAVGGGVQAASAASSEHSTSRRDVTPHSVARALLHSTACSSPCPRNSADRRARGGGWRCETQPCWPSALPVAPEAARPRRRRQPGRPARRRRWPPDQRRRRAPRMPRVPDSPGCAISAGDHARARRRRRPRATTPRRSTSTPGAMLGSDGAAIAWDAQRLYVTVQSAAFAHAVRAAPHLCRGRRRARQPRRRRGQGVQRARPAAAVHADPPDRGSPRHRRRAPAPYDGVFMPGRAVDDARDAAHRRHRCVRRGRRDLGAGAVDRARRLPARAAARDPRRARAPANEWKDLVPATHTPWQAPGGGYYEIDLTGAPIVTCSSASRNAAQTRVTRKRETARPEREGNPAAHTPASSTPRSAGEDATGPRPTRLEPTSASWAESRLRGKRGEGSGLEPPVCFRVFVTLGPLAERRAQEPRVLLELADHTGQQIHRVDIAELLADPRATRERRRGRPRSARRAA